MARLFVKKILLMTLVILIGVAAQAQPVDQLPAGQDVQSVVQLTPLLPQGRSVYDQYTLGDEVDGKFK